MKDFFIYLFTKPLSREVQAILGLIILLSIFLFIIWVIYSGKKTDWSKYVFQGSIVLLIILAVFAKDFESDNNEIDNINDCIQNKGYMVELYIEGHSSPCILENFTFCYSDGWEFFHEIDNENKKIILRLK